MEWIKRSALWLWNSLGNIILIGGWLGSAVLLAGATRAAGIMSAYAPFSWVLAGIFGGIIVAVSYVTMQIGLSLSQKIKVRRRGQI